MVDFITLVIIAMVVFILGFLIGYVTCRNRTESLDLEVDRTGLCTVRELAAEMIKAHSISGECVTELVFTDDAGRRINFECAVTRVDGVPFARQWAPILMEGKMTFDEFWADFDPCKTKGQELFKGHNYSIGKMVWEAARQ